MVSTIDFGDGSKYSTLVGVPTMDNNMLLHYLEGWQLVIENDGDIEVITMVTDTTQVLVILLFIIFFNSSLTLQKVGSDTLWCYRFRTQIQ